MTTFSYEALDRTHCVLMTGQSNLVEHNFYTNCKDYRDLIDQVNVLLNQAYQVAGDKWVEEEMSK